MIFFNVDQHFCLWYQFFTLLTLFKKSGTVGSVENNTRTWNTSFAIKIQIKIKRWSIKHKVFGIETIFIIHTNAHIFLSHFPLCNINPDCTMFLLKVTVMQSLIIRWCTLKSGAGSRKSGVARRELNVGKAFEKINLSQQLV